MGEMKEQWNGYTRDGVLTDVILTRGEPLPPGIYHISCEAVVKHIDGDYLVMHRDPDKELYPDRWEIGAAGSALLGETAVDCVKRELYEETGIICDDFTPIGSFTGDDTQYIMYSFLCVTRCDKNGIKLQKGENIGYKWLNKENFIKFINSPEIIDKQKERLLPFFKEMGYLE